MAQDQPRDTDSMSDIVDGLKDIAEANDHITAREVIAEFGSRSFAPIMLILALIGMLPTGGIPGVPTVVALMILLVAGQMAFGREHIWLPDFVIDRAVPAEKLKGANDKLEWVADRLDSLARRRLKSLTGGIAVRIVGAIIAVLCCFIPALELVPLAAALPFSAIALLSLSLIVKDGLLMLVAGALALGAIGYGATWLPF